MVGLVCQVELLRSPKVLIGYDKQKFMVQQSPCFPTPTDAHVHARMQATVPAPLSAHVPAYTLLSVLPFPASNIVIALARVFSILALSTQCFPFTPFVLFHVLDIWLLASDFHTFKIGLFHCPPIQKGQSLIISTNTLSEIHHNQKKLYRPADILEDGLQHTDA